jgi:hypothetical protein
MVRQLEQYTRAAGYSGTTGASLRLPAFCSARYRVNSFTKLQRFCSSCAFAFRIGQLCLFFYTMTSCESSDLELLAALLSYSLPLSKDPLPDEELLTCFWGFLFGFFHIVLHTVLWFWLLEGTRFSSSAYGSSTKSVSSLSMHFWASLGSPATKNLSSLFWVTTGRSKSTNALISSLILVRLPL